MARGALPTGQLQTSLPVRWARPGPTQTTCAIELRIVGCDLMVYFKLHGGTYSFDMIAGNWWSWAKRNGGLLGHTRPSLFCSEWCIRRLSSCRGILGGCLTQNSRAGGTLLRPGPVAMQTFPFSEERWTLSKVPITHRRVKLFIIPSVVVHLIMREWISSDGARHFCQVPKQLLPRVQRLPPPLAWTCERRFRGALLGAQALYWLHSTRCNRHHRESLGQGPSSLWSTRTSKMLIFSVWTNVPSWLIYSRRPRKRNKHVSSDG